MLDAIGSANRHYHLCVYLPIHLARSLEVGLEETEVTDWASRVYKGDIEALGEILPIDLSEKRLVTVKKIYGQGSPWGIKESTIYMAPLLLAAYKGDGAMMKHLIGKGACVHSASLAMVMEGDFTEDTLCMLAVKIGDEKLMELIFEKDPLWESNLSASAHEALTDALAATSNMKIIEQFLRSGFCLTRKSALYGETLLHKAASLGNVLLMDYCLNAGVLDIHIKDKKGLSPLIHAISCVETQKNPEDPSSSILYQNKKTIVLKLLEKGGLISEIEPCHLFSYFKMPVTPAKIDFLYFLEDRGFDFASIREKNLLGLMLESLTVYLKGEEIPEYFGLDFSFISFLMARAHPLPDLVAWAEHVYTAYVANKAIPDVLCEVGSMLQLTLYQLDQLNRRAEGAASGGAGSV